MRYSFQEREFTEAYAKRRTAPIESFGYEVRYTITSDDGSEPIQYETKQETAPIVVIRITRQYGRQDGEHITPLDYAHAPVHVYYAHNAEDALGWLFRTGEFADAVYTDLGDGRLLGYGPWQAFDATILALMAPDTPEHAISEQTTHVRRQVIIAPRVTIDEHTTGLD